MAFSASRAEHCIWWIEKYCRHTKGRFAGSPFLLRNWQKAIIRKLFGTVNTDGSRQYQTCYVEIPRKNGKSELAAAIALYLLLADGEPGAEIYSCACDRNQAAIVFKVAAAMVRKNRTLAKRCRITESTKTITVHKTESIYRVLSADGPRQHGLNPSGVIFDEVHTQKNRDLWEAMTTGSDTREQPLVFAITTAGVEGESPLWTELNGKATDIANEIYEDPTFMSVIYAAGEKDDWTDPEVWKRTNPALGDFLKMDKIAAACESAKNNPLEENSFRRLRLNQKTQQETRYIPMAEWNACIIPGMDLSYARNIATAA